MILLKTAAGQQAFKERHGALSLRQRSAFLLFDGQRSLAQVLEATAALGISWDDVRNMVDAGLLELAEAPSYALPGVVFDPSARGSVAFVAFAQEMVERAKKF